MKMTMKTAEAITYYKALTNFINKDADVPAQAAWDIDDNYNALKAVSDKYDKKQEELLSPLIEKDGLIQDGELIRPKPEYKKEFEEVTNKLNNFLGTDNEVEIKPIAREDLPDKFSVKDLIAIKFMLKEE